jgi:large conductance mechanosensitive channel
MGLVKEFREFAMKGNVVELAAAVIIGAAFGSIVSSAVDDVITPLLLTPALKAASVEDLDKLTWGAVKYGKFLAAILKFIIIALVLFVFVRGINTLKERKLEAPIKAELSLSEKTLLEIRDSLKK